MSPTDTYSTAGVSRSRARPLVKQHQLKLPGTQNPVQHQHPGLAAPAHGIATGTWSQCLHRLPSGGAGTGGGNLLLPPSSARTLLVPVPPRCPRASRPQLPGLCRRCFARRCSSPRQPLRAHSQLPWQRDEYFMQEHKSTSIIDGSAWSEHAATRGRARAASRGTSTSSSRPCPVRAPALLLPVPISPRFTSRHHKFPPTTSPQLRGHPEWLQSPANAKRRFLRGAISPLSPPPRVNPPHLCLHPGTTTSPGPQSPARAHDQRLETLSLSSPLHPGSVSHTSSPSVRPTLIN